jgi:hypothetical protein
MIQAITLLLCLQVPPEAAAPTPPPAEAPVETPAAVPEEAASAPAAPAAAEAPPMEVLDEAPFTPSMDFHIFSDANAVFESASGSTPAFAVGGVDFFATAELAPNVRALSESVLEILPDGVVFDLERVYLEWQIASVLSLRFGRDHMMLGNYMSAFHHALLFQLTASRPKLLSFEDDGGLLPAHQTGITAMGEVGVGDVMRVRYMLGVGNGRGQFADDVLSTFDRNFFKSITARVIVAPSFVYGLEIGASGYLDEIPPGFVGPGHHGPTGAGEIFIEKPIQEVIATGHLVYNNYPFDVASEFYWVNHTTEGLPQTGLIGGFAQIGYTLSAFTPYARYEFASRSAEDQFFNASGGPTDINEVTAGTRFTLSDQAVLKAEYTRDFVIGNDIVTVQAAFGL